MELVLASASPRRQELLGLLCRDFIVDTLDTDEHTPPFSPQETVSHLARRKSMAVFEKRDGQDVVIGSDTVVAIGDKILGKPVDVAAAQEMLRQLAGKEHWVYTGVHVATPYGSRGFVSGTQVIFAPMSQEEIESYAACGEGLDKAGAYAVQGLGARFIKELRGDYYTVMGLPVQGLYHLLNDLLGDWWQERCTLNR